jgi:putative membrane protein
MMGNGYGFGFGIPGIGMWIIWILLIVAIVWVVKLLSDRNAPGSGCKSALEILQERYARGEIDRDEYESKRRDLLG